MDDDNSLVKGIFAEFQEELMHEGKNVTFDYVTDIRSFNIEQPYDIIMFDCDFMQAKHDMFEGNPRTIGFELIKKFRQKNIRTKIIFYSSFFDLADLDQIPLSTKDFFEIINELNVFRLVNKNDATQIFNTILDALDELDIIMVTLEKMVYDYVGADMTYNVNGRTVSIQDLIRDFKMGGERSKSFEEKVLKMLISYMTKFKI